MFNNLLWRSNDCTPWSSFWICHLFGNCLYKIAIFWCELEQILTACGNLILLYPVDPCTVPSVTIVSSWSFLFRSTVDGQNPWFECAARPILLELPKAPYGQLYFPHCAVVTRCSGCVFQYKIHTCKPKPGAVRNRTVEYYNIALHGQSSGVSMSGKITIKFNMYAGPFSIEPYYMKISIFNLLIKECLKYNVIISLIKISLCSWCFLS